MCYVVLNFLAIILFLWTLPSTVLNIEYLQSSLKPLTISTDGLQSEKILSLRRYKILRWECCYCSTGISIEDTLHKSVPFALVHSRETRQRRAMYTIDIRHARTNRRSDSFLYSTASLWNDFSTYFSLKDPLQSIPKYGIEPVESNLLRGLLYRVNKQI